MIDWSDVKWDILDNSRKATIRDINDNFVNLSQEQFEFLQYYFNSIGYIIRYKKIFLDDEQTVLCKVDIWFDELKRQTTCDGRTIII